MKKIITTIIILYLAINSSFLFAQITLTIEGTVVNNSEAGTWEGVNIQRNVPASFTYRNNSITSVNTSGYILQAGDESVAACNNNLNGEIITGNKFIWNGTDMTSITHGVFTGNNINAVIKYNYLYQVPMGIIRKSASNMTNASGSVAYNIINRGMIGVVVKGMSGVNIYNNTFYSDRNFANTASGRGIIDVYTNEDVSPNSVSHGTKIKNNIFYTKYQVNNIRILDNESLTDFECDYNVYWCEAGTPKFDVNGSVITFAQWQALGYDTHSIVVNPNFINFTDFVPTARLNYGTDLGTTWNTGLSTSAVWIVNSTPATTVQNESWQVGARVYAAASSGNTYYISPLGSDGNTGTIGSPWKTLTKVWSHGLSAGDIVYLRGGTYLFPTSQELTGKNGTAGNLIKIWAYPGETPIIKKAGGWTYINREGIHFEGNYFHWKGIEITGFTQLDEYLMVGFRTINSSHNIFELLNCHDNSRGFELTEGCNDNLVLNCDFHHNYDPLSGTPYGNSDGLAVNPPANATLTIRGCRSWNNGDDGFDLFRSDCMITVDNCWSWMNGYRADGTTRGGDGWGFKGGITNTNQGAVHLRTFTNCMAFHNREGGFGQNEAQCIFWLYNNIAYHNNDGGSNPGYFLGFWFSSYGGTGYAHIAKNNIAYANQNTNGLDALWSAETTENHNSWDAGVTVTDADFVTVSSTGVDGPRQADGSLPVINFLKLATRSKLIDAGVNVGILYGGNAPDLGAFEMQTGTTNPIPVFTSAIVENTTPSLLGMTYDLNLNNLVVPSASAFAVRVNSIVKTVNTVGISGNKVQLTLASAIKFGDIVTVSYTKPASNPLQTVTGEQAISISAQSIINNLINPTKDVTPGAITMTITPNHIHRIINILLQYTSSFSVLDPAMSPQIIRIFNISGKLFLEKLLVTGAANIKLPINLSSGIYTVLMFSGGLQMASQKIIVY